MPEKPKLPSPEKIRILTASKDLKPEDADRHGDLFLDGDHPAQAMMFYERSKNPERFQRVKEHAVRDGDAFLLLWLARLAPDLVTAEEWAKAGENALAAGKLLFARDCFEKAEMPDRAVEVRQKYLDIFRPPPKA